MEKFLREVANHTTAPKVFCFLTVANLNKLKPQKVGAPKPEDSCHKASNPNGPSPYKAYDSFNAAKTQTLLQTSIRPKPQPFPKLAT